MKRQNRYEMNNLKFLNSSEVENIKKLKKPGYKNGQKNDLNPLLEQDLTLSQLSYNQSIKTPPPAQKRQYLISQQTTTSEQSHFFKYKKNEVIAPNAEHENIKASIISKLPPIPQYSKLNRLSQLEIRVERPDGVSHDELNSDEKAFFAFYKRSYLNYINKIFSNYEDYRRSHPNLEQKMTDEHLLIAKIDYDQNGNIEIIKILKSSESDDVHQFFENSLKQLSLPNPPKVFIKNGKSFSVYYQLRIN